MSLSNFPRKPLQLLTADRPFSNPYSFIPSSSSTSSIHSASISIMADTTSDELTQLLGNLSLSNTKSKQMIRARNQEGIKEYGHRCITCPAVFSTHSELVEHIRKRKHRADLKELKADKEEFKARVDARPKEGWTAEEKATHYGLIFREACLEFMRGQASYD